MHSFARAALSVLFVSLALAWSASPIHGADRPSIVVNLVEVYTTAKDTGERMHHGADLSLERDQQPTERFPTVIIDPNATFQTMVGIGGALTDAAAETFADLPPICQQELLTAYFDPIKGNGYSLCRTSINSCDFSSESYSYDEMPGDIQLEHFSIKHDLRYRVPLIKAALNAARGQILVFASPWSPPAWMKSNGDMLHGGRVRPEYRQTWANYYGKFIRAYAKQGIKIWGLTVQNEQMSAQRWESCLLTADEECAFVRDFLGPSLTAEGLGDTKVMIWDHNRGLIYQRAREVYNDPAAAKFVWGTAFHWYSGDHFDNVKQTHEAWPGKNLMLSEACAENFDRNQISEWHFGERYATSIIHDLNNWAVGWTDWNILLNEQGGPNHVGNFCFAPVIFDRPTGKLVYMNSFYYLGHFSRFIRPGAKRIAATSNDDRLSVTSFLNANGKIATIVLNTTETAIPFEFWVDGYGAKSSMPAHSIATLLVTMK